MAALKWKGTPDGGATLKMNALTLVVRLRDGGGYECIVYNAGQYKRLYQSAYPIPGDLSSAKEACKLAAFNVLKGELSALALEGIE